ncbi:MAG: DUF1178 family protein [Novosphingobium sp.]
MITFDLECRAAGHRFEGWFGSSDDYALQQERGLVSCPQCGSVDVIKAPMAPNVARKGNQVSLPRLASPPLPPTPNQPMSKGAIPPEALKVMQAMAIMQAKALEKSQWVGDRFAAESRAIHYGETEPQAIHGQATAKEAMELLEEGIEVAPLPFPVAPPGETN